MFGGDDDIFADIPSKSKEKKSRVSTGAAKKTSTSKKATIDDDMGKRFIRTITSGTEMCDPINALTNYMKQHSDLFPYQKVPTSI